MSTYERLVNIVEGLGPPFLERHREDLTTHDRVVLEEYDGPFLWMVREGGTHILTERAAPCRWRNMVRAWTSMASGDLFADEARRFFFYNEETLSPVEPDQVYAHATALGWTDKPEK